jgi:hypothetical protein
MPSPQGAESRHHRRRQRYWPRRAIAYAREGADLLIAYLNETEEQLVEHEGRKAVPGQPVELATTYVMLADPMSSYVSGATVPVTGGKPFI